MAKKLAKEVTIKLGSPEEARFFRIGHVLVSAVNNAVGEVTLRYEDGIAGTRAKEDDARFSPVEID